ncbi:MAG: sulfur carrier protein ThiS [Pseudomonadales bacterium]
MSLEVLINNQSVILQAGQTLQSLLDDFGAQEPYVVAINQTFVPRSCYHQQSLQAGDRIEVLQPIQGG